MTVLLQAEDENTINLNLVTFTFLRSTKTLFESVSRNTRYYYYDAHSSSFVTTCNNKIKEGLKRKNKWRIIIQRKIAQF